jgi:hypothetical protein
MIPQNRAYFVLLVALLSGCQAPWDPFVGCAEFDACTTEPASTGGGDEPTSAGGVHTVTGAGDDSSGGAAGTDTGDETTGTTGEPAAPPVVVDFEVSPDPIWELGYVAITVYTSDAVGVEMELESGEVIELTPAGANKFEGKIAAFTGLDNGPRTALLTPWADVVVGDTVPADYNIALPEAGSEKFWETGDLIGGGHVAAMGVLPDGRVIEFGTYYPMGEARCYLRARDKAGAWTLEDFVPILPTAYCTATDMTIDRETGMLHVLVNRKTDNGLLWWVGEISAWGYGPKNIATGVLGDKALALARGRGKVAVCGSKPVPTGDDDAFAVVIPQNQTGEERLYDYVSPNNPMESHTFDEAALDCTFSGDSGDTLVLVGEAYGKHDGDVFPKRDRLMVIESDVLVDDEPHWTVAGLGPGVQSRAHAVDVDDDGRYILAVSTCLDVCEPEGELRVYEPGGELTWQRPLGPLGSAWFGPHDVAWTSAGYAVIAYGATQGQSPVFQAQAFAIGTHEPLWTFTPNDKQGAQMALTLAAGAHGEIYVGGIAGNYPAVCYINP